MVVWITEQKHNHDKFIKTSLSYGRLYEPTFSAAQTFRQFETLILVNFHI